MEYGLFYDNVKEAARTEGICPEEILRQGARLGLLNYLECSLGDLISGELSRELLKELNLGISPCVHCTPDGSLVYNRDRALLDLPEYLAQAGAKHVLLVPIVSPGLDAKDQVYFRQLVESVTPFVHKARELGLRVSFEDFDHVISPCGGARDQLRYCEHIPGLGVTFDTGNYQFHREDPLEVFPLVAEKICHVHVKDRVSTDPHSLSAVTGQGCLPLKKLLTLLKEQGYQGRLTAEMYGAPASTENLMNALRFLKENWG